MPKKIWIINQYTSTNRLKGRSGQRLFYLGKEFIKKDFDVTLITTAFNHLRIENHQTKRKYDLVNEEELNILLVRCLEYQKSIGIKRILNWFIFLYRLFFIPKKMISKPDIIVVSSLSLLPILFAVYIQSRYKVKFILEIRDIWPLSLVELKGFSKYNPLVLFLSWIEMLGYKKANHIVSVLSRTDIHIANRLGHKNFKFTWISNGVNIDKEALVEPLTKELKAKIPKDKFVIGHAGAMGLPNALDVIVECMSRFRGSNVYLCLVGKGDERESLIKLADLNPNIIFLDQIPKSQIQSFLCKCDALYIGGRNVEIYKYGVSPNKLFEYMYASKLVISPVYTETNPIVLSKNGIPVIPEDVDDLERVIHQVLKMNITERERMGERGKKYLLNHFTYQKLSEKYIKIFNEL